VQEIACPGLTGNLTLRVESLPFAEIPGQSKLFLDYQKDPVSLRRFYPTAVASHTDIAGHIPDVLANYRTDRSVLCDALDEINRSAQAGEKVFENIQRLRDTDCVAVVSGQQAGLFTGPLYTIYKALSAVRAAECLTGRGFKAVPVFWIATEDHDFVEVDQAVVIDREGRLAETSSGAEHLEGEPVGRVALNDSIGKNINAVFDSLTQTEFTPALRNLVEDSYSTGEGFGCAFAKMISALTSEYGLILVDPLHPVLKRLVAPCYVSAIERSSATVSAVVERGRELRQSGYDEQVSVTDDHFPLFWHSDDGRRHTLRSTANGKLRAKGLDREFTLNELAASAAEHPERFSPNVILRPVVQDYLLPTVCYFGGGAEIAYFAQNSEVYRCLNRPVTPILHRQSFTVVEHRHQRTLESYGIAFADLFGGLESLMPKIVDKYLDPQTAKTFAEVEEVINAQLNRLDRELSAIDRGLAENLATRRRKIIYHISALHKKFRAVEIKKNETIDRRLHSLFASLLPDDGLQERTLNVINFLNHHGPRFVDWMYRSIDLDDKSHRVVYL
jgi:bacillithiol biosynthesis cysteine-adding enzyme BshC